MVIYALIGALLMLLTFKVDEFKAKTPLYIANMNIDRMTRGEKPITNEKSFTAALLVVMCLIFVLAWPLVLIYAFVKTVLE